jgi:hypothetical protein
MRRIADWGLGIALGNDFVLALLIGQGGCLRQHQFAANTNPTRQRGHQVGRWLRRRMKANPSLAAASG